jgi:hypothetical protein
VARSFVGRVEARQESDLGFEIDGMVVGVEVEEGDIVEVGGVIATLGSERLRARRGTSWRRSGWTASATSTSATPRPMTNSTGRTGLSLPPRPTRSGATWRAYGSTPGG